MKYLHWVPRAQVIASDLLADFTPDKLVMKARPEAHHDNF
jgi:hypothetical protein